jgi:hypothetical protein
VEQAGHGGCVIDLHTGFKGCVSSAYCSYACDIVVSAGAGVTHEQRARTQLPVSSIVGIGWRNLFSLPPMKTGWDAAVWASTHLPADSQLSIYLRVYNVLHAAAAPHQPAPPQPGRRGTPRAS